MFGEGVGAAASDFDQVLGCPVVGLSGVGVGAAASHIDQVLRFPRDGDHQDRVSRRKATGCFVSLD
ncbi:hypothetical protein Ssi02_19360 [Sinosporangium siamense]|uniref:Uncharacterized protein n=1 Tax=Sinosporangium siamense TaxID=1367973 RepID=A0A919RD36_9ACTN|nr:hypothetical protein Ssi02_19360 [Sinosporangium siamense]